MIIGSELSSTWNKYIVLSAGFRNSLWRLIRGPVEDNPMIFCDPSYLNPETDIVAVDRVGSEYVGKVYYLVHNASHRWHYPGDQWTDEGTLFVSFDSNGMYGVYRRPGRHKDKSSRVIKDCLMTPVSLLTI
jgi:hypothetical protein